MGVINLSPRQQKFPPITFKNSAVAMTIHAYPAEEIRQSTQSKIVYTFAVGFRNVLI